MRTSRGRRSEGGGLRWRPAATLDVLRARADLLDRVRAFFRDRSVLEVETPALSRRAVSDLHLASFSTRYDGPGADDPEGDALFLVTSPELAMKRLLAAGSGAIFQIGRAFRNGERGRLHNPEFTLLEWYRPGFDAGALMDEVEALLAVVAGAGRCERRSYGELFSAAVGLDPHRASLDELEDALRRADPGAPAPADLDEAVQRLFGLRVEPGLGHSAPTFVFDYPRGQAALARVRPGDPPVAERFELYWRGVELANGFRELTDAEEQARRFAGDLERRRRRGLPAPPADERFLAALAAGLPDCSGVALGVDRLLMLQLGLDSIDQVLAFPLPNA